ncbi:cation/H(+) antiporter 15-like [Corylus avellana]|uniref:cation/H(+) antiporter 15-like n=1 Tax=Corylus avellana TaxID=13451 RepID=UPI001E22E721|nr:cation/H(+) antiporter 15-like [Corylus avellana]
MAKDEWIVIETIDKFEACYRKNITGSRGLWRAENALIASLPQFILQLFLIILIIRIVALLLKPLRQPRIMAEILGGVILGRSGLGASMLFLSYVFPLKSLVALETIANLSVVYYMFLVGLETDVSLILRAGKKAYSVAFAGIIISFPVGYGLFQFLRPHPNIPGSGLFWAAGLACTNFQELARILAEVKLLRSKVGRTALTASMISDLSCWVFLVLTQAVLEKGREIALGSTLGFMLFLVFAVHPALKWVINRISKEDNFNEFHVCCVLTGVILCGFISDACGAHSIAGAFMLGVIMPKGELKDILIEKVEDFVSGFMMPLFFIIIGIRTNISEIAYGISFGRTLLIILLACLPKLLSTWLISLFFRMSTLDALALGLLMSTKGLLAFIILNSGRTKKALDNQTFSILVVTFWLMTLVIGPILTCIYKRTRHGRQSKRRNIQSARQDSEFLILACVHSMRNVSGIITLIQASIANQLSPVSIFVVHLVELAGRASSMLIVHDTYGMFSDKINGNSTTSTSTNSTAARTRAHPDSVLGAFKSLETKGNNGVTVHPLTAMSAYDSMHEDICSLAEDKRVLLILLPFHKQPTIDGGMEDSNPVLRGVNQNVLANASCSVGIFVDRGLSTSATSRESNHGNNIGLHFAMLFIGGRDDREALAYAWRLLGNTSMRLDIIRFVLGDDHLNPIDHNHQGDHNDDKEEILATPKDNDKEKQLDDEYIADFIQSSSSNPSIRYIEKVANNGEETLKVISNLEHEYDLYIVGRREGMVSPLTSGLTEWSDFPELGALGDTLVSSSFSSDVSVLIIQQEVGGDGGGGTIRGGGGIGGGGERGGGGGEETENNEREHTGKLKEQFGHMTWEPPPKDNTDKEPFVHRPEGDYDHHEDDDDF